MDNEAQHAMKYPHRAEILRHTAGATDNRGRETQTLTSVTTNHPCDVQLQQGNVVETPSGAVRTGVWTGFFAPGLQLKLEDRVRITAVLVDGAGLPGTGKFKVEQVENRGGRWGSRAELESTTETFPEEA